MADSTERITTEVPSQAEQPTQAVAEPQKVEISIEPEKPSAPASDPAPIAKPQKQDDFSLLSSAILEAMSSDISKLSQAELRSHITHLQSLLSKVIELLKEKTNLCSNLEKQNTALMLQCNSLKDVVGLTKDMLSIRNVEVEYLHVDIKSMEEKINVERERHTNMLNRMAEAVKLNENLKAEYQSQLSLLSELRTRYEEKVALLERENKRLAALVPGSVSIASEQTGEGEGVAVPPP